MPEVAAATRPIGLLTVGTRNLGDHIQVIAAEELLRRAGMIPSFQVDRDNGVAAPPRVPDDPAPGLILNGWFKRNPRGLAPSSRLSHAAEPRARTAVRRGVGALRRAWPDRVPGPLHAFAVARVRRGRVPQ